MSFSIFSATSIEQIRLAAELYPEYSQTERYVGSPEYEYDHIKNGNRLLLYAENDKNIVGVVQLLIKSAQPAKLMRRNYGLLQRLRVVPDYRRLGVATQLCQEVEREALMKKLKGISLVLESENIAAQTFYTKLGYIFIGSTDVESPGRCLLAYEKTLV